MFSQPFRTFLLTAGLLLSLLPPCLAQDAKMVRLRFLSFPKSRESVTVELRLSAEKTVAIVAASNEFSEPMLVASTGVWAVGETVKDPAGKPVFREYGRTQAPASPEQVLILVRKGDANSDGFDLLALDVRVNAFGGGKFLFMNAAKVDIAGVVGEEKFIIKTGKHVVIQPKPDASKRLAQAMFYFRKDDEARPFFSSRWPVNDRCRNLIFFYHDPYTRCIRMHTIRDFL